MSLKSHLRRMARRIIDFARHEDLPVMNHPARVTGLEHASVRVTAQLLVEDPENGMGARIVLGPGAYVGERVLLVASRAGDIDIGNDTSLQNDCMVGGDVRIGGHCLFGKYVFASSTQHRFADNPAWLIKDQDRMADAGSAALKPALSRKIIIEDDCWIGQGAVINPGIEIGRGAVIGANCVVTRNVGPYEIHGGVPNRSIGRRLKFSPPAALHAATDEHLPYFYRGLRLSRDELATSRTEGVVIARGTATLVLCGASSGHAVLQGHSTCAMQIEVAINGISCGVHDADGAFAIRAAIPRAKGTVPKTLADFTMVEITPRSPGSYGISSASLEVQ